MEIPDQAERLREALEPRREGWGLAEVPERDLTWAERRTLEALGYVVSSGDDEESLKLAIGVRSRNWTYFQGRLHPYSWFAETPQIFDECTNIE